MSIRTMMYNGASGISSMGSNMSVLSDNVANLNSVAFKTSRMTFQEAITSAQGYLGEMGHGAQVGSVGRSFQPGQLENTNNATDVAIAGRGFFMVRDPLQTSAELYSRDGQFHLNGAAGETDQNLVNTQGGFVQGYNFDATGTLGGALEDIVIRGESLPKATENVTAAVNLQNDPRRLETTDAPLYTTWDGSNPDGPIGDGDFDYRTIIKANDDAGTQFDLNLYFDHTSNQGEQEFLLTCDPALDRRLIGATTTRYNDGPVPEKGAGALLYGKLFFDSSGELAGIDCWEVPPNGGLNPTDSNKLNLGRGMTDYSFSYNVSGNDENLTSTLNFGTEPLPQAVTSPGAAVASADSDAPYVSALTSWDSIYDATGKKVQNGDVITFTGTDGEGDPASLAYTVDTNLRLDDLLTRLGDQFNCVATVAQGQLHLTDEVGGQSQLAIDAVSYRDAAGNTPLTDSSMAQIFGTEGGEFSITPSDPYAPGVITTTNYASPSATIFQQQDGYQKGYLEDVAIGKQGVISGLYSNGQRIDQAQLALADFADLQDMTHLGGNLFTAPAAGGAPTIGLPGEGALGAVQGKALEMSNVDLGHQFADLIITQRGFQANSKAISTANELYEAALRLK